MKFVDEDLELTPLEPALEIEGPLPKRVFKRRDTDFINKRFNDTDNDTSCDKCFKAICCTGSGQGVPLNFCKGFFWFLLLISIVGF